MRRKSVQLSNSEIMARTISSGIIVRFKKPAVATIVPPFYGCLEFRNVRASTFWSPNTTAVNCGDEDFISQSSVKYEVGTLSRAV